MQAPRADKDGHFHHRLSVHPYLSVRDRLGEVRG